MSVQSYAVPRLNLNFLTFSLAFIVVVHLVVAMDVGRYIRLFLQRHFPLLLPGLRSGVGVGHCGCTALSLPDVATATKNRF